MLHTKKQLLILIIILAAGFILRGIYLCEIITKPSFQSPDIDARFHDYWAKGLALNDWTVPSGLPDPEIQKKPYTRPPLYPYFLALIYAIGGYNYLLVRIVQMSLGLINSLLAFILAKRWFSNNVALITAALMCTNWVFIYFEGELLAPVLVIFLSLCMMLALSSWAKKFTYTTTIIAGVFFGLAALARPNILLFAPAVLAWAVWLKFKNKEQRLIKAVTGFILCSILIISPVTVRNYLVSRDFVLITSTAGLNLYIGNNEQTSCVHPVIPRLEELIGKDRWTSFDCPDIQRAIEKEAGRQMKPSEVSKYFSKRALGFIRNNPGRTINLTIQKALLFWGPLEASNNTVIEMERKDSVLKYLPGFSPALSLFLLGSGLLCWDIRKRKKSSMEPESTNEQFSVFILMILFIIVYSASYLPFFVAARFRVLVTPFMLIPAAYGIERIIHFIYTKNLKASVLSITVPIVLYAIVSHNFAEYKPDVAFWHEGNADILLRTGHPERAIDKYRKSLQLKPHNHRALLRLGRAYFQTQNYEQAVNYWEKAVSIKPDDKETHASIGQALAKLSDFDNAIRHWFIAASLDPNEPSFYYNIGLAYHRKGMLDEAIENYKKTLSINPNHQKAKKNLDIAILRNSLPEKQKN